MECARLFTVIFGGDVVAMLMNVESGRDTISGCGN